MDVDYFGYFGITKEVNSMTINSQGWSLIFSIGTILIIFLILIKILKKNYLIAWLIGLLILSQIIPHLVNVSYGLRNKILNM